MDQKSDGTAIADEMFTSVDATPLQIEKAKVQAFNRQLSRSLDEKRQLQIMLKQTQADLEKQIQKTLRLQKIQAKSCMDAMEKQAPAPCAEKQELKNELASTQKDLADEISKSQRREARLQKIQDQCNDYKDQLDSLKQQQHEQEEGADDKSSMKKWIKNLEHQRSELLLVVKKQMKLIDILKQQRAHVEAAALLNITERDFMKEVNCG
mmetsp:Transcript_6215/g.13527  ORF Transcript_6215/g.13527 Transcript_6215/m.13527 type:complete len:209 (-) Transcript_6215:989-1615(-)